MFRLILGDVNYDESLNVLDVVVLVGMILGSQSPIIMQVI